MIATMFGCGLRVSEMLALRPSDVDLRAGTVQVLHGKGDKYRIVGLDQALAPYIELWLPVRRTIPVARGGPLFCTLKGDPVSDRYVRALIARLGHKAELDKRTHPHALRHGFAAGLANEGTPMNVIRDALGHASLATTDRYLRMVNPTAVIETMKQRNWDQD
jgi:site-specific recombinase XerD